MIISDGFSFGDSGTVEQERRGRAGSKHIFTDALQVEGKHLAYDHIGSKILG
jgi:hypothetical protein